MTEQIPFSETHIAVAGIWRCGQVKCSYLPAEQEEHAAHLAYIKEFWDSYQQSHPAAFDGPLLGLSAIDCGDSNELHLLVKQTSYSQYVATRDPSFATRCPGIKRADPIGITTVVISSDERVVVTRRSASAEQNPGLLYFIGGYAEPPGAEPLDDLICRNARRELSEELGVASSNPMLILGLALDPVYCHPEFFLVTRLAVPASAIADLWQRATARQEASELMLLPISEFWSTSNEILFPEGVTWSFEVGAFLLRKFRDGVSTLLR
jgi:8-oxo-dGTP pyrophosphatase MutT (NUDIX family)